MIQEIIYSYTGRAGVCDLYEKGALLNEREVLQICGSFFFQGPVIAEKWLKD